LADLRAEGASAALSYRLAEAGAKPEGVLGQYLTSLNQSTTMRR